NVGDRLAREPLVLQFLAVLSAAPHRQLVHREAPQRRDEPTFKGRGVVLPRRGMQFGVHDDGAIDTKRGSPRVPGGEVRRHPDASGDGGRVELLESCAVGEVTAIIKGAEGDFPLDDLEGRRAPASVIRGVSEVGELPAAGAPPPEVKKQLAVLGSNAHGVSSVPTAAWLPEPGALLPSTASRPMRT